MLLFIASLAMNVGKTSEPVKGLRGYFVIRLTEKTPFDSSAFQAQSTVLKNNLIQEKKSSALNTWLFEIKENAEIVDNRYMFYGY